MLLPSPASPSTFAAGPTLTVTSPLQLQPSQPAPGQLVTARFTVRNDGAAPVTLNRIGVGGRGPGCADFACTKYQDFKLLPLVTVAPGQSLTYAEQRTFKDEGAYLAQIVYEAPANIWQFLGQRIRFSVVGALYVSAPLKFNFPQPTTRDLVVAEFALTNGTRAPVTLQRAGAGGRGPDCGQAGFGCTRVADYPFATNVTIQPGATWSFRGWRLYSAPGQYFAQISIQDAVGAWKQLGERPNLAVTAGIYAPRSSPLPFGAQWHPAWDPATDDVQLGLAVAVGAKFIRIGPSWKNLEPTGKGQWSSGYIAALDRIIAGANQRGIKIIVMLLQTPCWASSDPAKNCAANQYDQYYPPINDADYAAAIGKLVELFGDRVAAWEVWNEPNIKQFWKPAPDAARYVRMLKTAYTAIKSRRPNATVLGGALAGIDLTFLDAMYAAGAKGAFDGLALHPYTDIPPTTCNDVRWSFACGLDGVNSLMLQNGDSKQLWLTEYGWSTYAGYKGVSEATQLAHLQSALAELQRRDYVAAATWYTLVDTAFVLPPERAYDNFFGLYYRDHRPKPAAQWLQSQALAADVEAPPALSEDPFAASERVYLPYLQREADLDVHSVTE